MNYKGAVFFDYDGTLADEKKGIYYPTDTTKKALKKLKENGYFVALATGRAKCYVPNVGIDFDGYVTVNGACAEIGEKIVYEKFIEPDKLSELIREFDKMGLYYSLETHDICYANEPENEKFVAMLENFNISKEVYVKLNKSSLPSTLKLNLVYNSERETERLAELFKGFFVFEKHRKFPSCDVSQKGITKATGIKNLSESLFIARENIYAFGDGENDFEMIKYAGHGVAMGVHAESLDKAADYVTDTVEDEGIYKALKKYDLI